MNTKTQATARPCHYKKDGLQFRQIIYGKDNKPLGTTNDSVNYILSQNKAKTNAELIVKAVNNHDSLLEACKQQHQAIDALFAMLIETKDGFYPSKTGWIWDACTNGNEVINKAEG